MPNTALDGHIHVVAALIRHPQEPDKILISRRKIGTHLEKLWELPGGKVEAGESRFQALKRELKEELELQLIAAQPFQSVFHRYAEKKIHLDVWEVKSYRHTARGAEGQEIRWVKLKELAEYPFPDADKPILAALQLPPEILITPEVTEGHENTFIDQFERVMLKHPYRLIQFRSHNLNDKRYAKIAGKMNEICRLGVGEIVIARPQLKSLQSRSFKEYRWRHLNSRVLQSLTGNPFDNSINLAASCHDQAELTMAERLGCRFSVLSAVRETPSHPGREGKGWHRIRQLIGRSGIPVYALGGIRRRDFCVARFQGAVGVAGISDFWIV